MQLFQCQACGQRLYFENVRCERCGRALGYLTDVGVLSALEPDGAAWTAYARPAGRYRFCRNWEQMGCNWMVDAAQEHTYCAACRHNRTIPDISLAENLINWQKIEVAKRRLMYAILRFGLPHPTAASGDPEPLVFEFLAEVPGGPKVMTGHDNGVITIALKEADDATREAARASMGELYRTLLGHFRHEVGHYYWDKLVRDGGHLESYRALFGDERADYGEAVQRHYRDGPPVDWREHYVSSYATMHPWEDWAETWAHYLHIVDTLEMAGAFGISITPTVGDDAGTQTRISFDAYHAGDVQTLLDAWLPLTYAVNSLNRSMGQPDLYPFVIPPPVAIKLGYVHELVARARGLG
ncbi:hypothetical protein FOZ76_23440 [Verticiella sediminum]|uniref:Zinc-ribbon domain-containing protein n=1 Tax=Verticiella sediminum TaxID=1247510 RepID=A0A556ACY4_9BURK|nr:putative zinc-binding peptidase [Verticiella sediminum]TSH90739.1 hypothetical protein FOZ76_23440 [Verticiella sediminum]